MADTPARRRRAPEAGGDDAAAAARDRRRGSSSRFARGRRRFRAGSVGVARRSAKLPLFIHTVGGARRRMGGVVRAADSRDRTTSTGCYSTTPCRAVVAPPAADRLSRAFERRVLARALFWCCGRRIATWHTHSRGAAAHAHRGGRHFSRGTARGHMMAPRSHGPRSPCRCLAWATAWASSRVVVPRARHARRSSQCA